MTDHDSKLPSPAYFEERDALALLVPRAKVLAALADAYDAAPAAPVLFVSPGQLSIHTDPDAAQDGMPHGRYLPARKTPAGEFTQPLYALPPAVPEALGAPGTEGLALSPVERQAVDALCAVALAARHVAEDSPYDGNGTVPVEHSDMEALIGALDKLDSLPDDQPGYLMDPAAKAAWALRRLLDAPPALEAPAALAAKPGGMIAVPFDLVVAACSAIDKKRDAPKILAELRRYTTGDLSRAALAAAPQAPAAPVESGPAGSGGWQAHAEQMERERDHWRDRARVMSEHKEGVVWYWQGDGEDHPESWVNTLPVVIRADELRALMGPAAPAAPAVDALQDARSAVAAIASVGQYNDQDVVLRQSVLAMLDYRIAAPAVDTSFEDRISDWAHGDSLDADRYRTWRDNMIADTGPAFHGVVAAALPPGVGVDRRPTAEEWDAAIDAARAAQGKEVGAA